jgi:hypothetical protein
MIIGFSAKTKDKRVDKIAIEHGYDNYEIFYSPIFIWIFFTIYLLILSLPITFQFYNYWHYLLGYLFIGYLISSYLNNSFIITEKELLIINPNFPFTNFRTYKIDRIEKVKIDKNKWLNLLACLMIFENNYVQIYSGKKSRIYYCNGLNLDAFDENLTEKTLDDFSFSLTRKNIVVELKID